MNEFWVVFVALFVAVDPIGTLPIFMGLTDCCERPRVRKIVLSSVVTALLVGHFFMAVGKSVLKILGISMADFMVAGGIILFLLTTRDLLRFESKKQSMCSDDIGPVPIGVPLIVGPAVITAAMLLMDQHGFKVTSMALSLNVIIAGVIFYYSKEFTRVLGDSGGKIVSKLAALLLAAYAVMMVRKGVFLMR